MKKPFSLVILWLIMILSSSALANAQDELIEKIEQAIHEKRFNDALRLNVELKTKEPLNPEHLRRDALIYLEAARTVDGPSSHTYYQTALTILDNAIRVGMRGYATSREIAEMFNDKALIYWEMEDYRNMMQEAEKALSIDPENAMAYYHLGNAHMWTGFSINPEEPPQEIIEESVKYYEQALDLNQGRLLMPYAYYFVGVDKYLSDDFDTAFTYLLNFLFEMYHRKDQLGETLRNYELRWMDMAYEVLEEIEPMIWLSQFREVGLID